MTNAADIKYIKDMIPHHEMALKMSAMEYVNGTDPDLKEFSLTVFIKQSEEITWMKKWLERNGESDPKAKGMA